MKNNSKRVYTGLYFINRREKNKIFLLTTFALDGGCRDIATFNMSRAHINAKIPDNNMVVIKLEGEFVDIVTDFNPDLKGDILYERVKELLCMKNCKSIIWV